MCVRIYTIEPYNARYMAIYLYITSIKQMSFYHYTQNMTLHSLYNVREYNILLVKSEFLVSA